MLTIIFKLIAAPSDDIPFEGNDFDSGWLFHKLRDCKTTQEACDVKIAFAEKLCLKLDSKREKIAAFWRLNLETGEKLESAAQNQPLTEVTDELDDLTSKLPDFVMELTGELKAAKKDSAAKPIILKLRETAEMLSVMKDLLAQGHDIQFGFKKAKDPSQALEKESQIGGIYLPPDHSAVGKLVDESKVSVIVLSNGQRIAQTHRDVDSQGHATEEGFLDGGNMNRIKPGHIQTSPDGPWEPVMLRKTSPDEDLTDEDLTPFHNVLDCLENRLAAQEKLMEGGIPDSIRDHTVLEERPCIVFRFSKKGPMVMETAQRLDTPYNDGQVERSINEDLKSDLSPADRTKHKLRRLNQILKLGRAITAMHERGIIYRDLNTRNMVCDDKKGSIKLIDPDGMCLKEDMRVGEIFGSPGFTPVEELGDNQAPFAERADLWAFGVSVLQALDFKTVESVYLGPIIGSEDEETFTIKEKQEMLNSIKTKILTEQGALIDKEVSSGFCQSFLESLFKVCFDKVYEPANADELQEVLAFSEQIPLLPIQTGPLFADSLLTQSRIKYREFQLEALKEDSEGSDGLNSAFENCILYLSGALYHQPDNLEMLQLLRDLYSNNKSPLTDGAREYAVSELDGRIERVKASSVSKTGETQDVKPETKTVPSVDFVKANALVMSLRKQGYLAAQIMDQLAKELPQFNELPLSEKTELLQALGLVDLEIMIELADVEEAIEKAENKVAGLSMLNKFLDQLIESKAADAQLVTLTTIIELLGLVSEIEGDAALNMTPTWKKLSTLLGVRGPKPKTLEKALKTLSDLSIATQPCSKTYTQWLKAYWENERATICTPANEDEVDERKSPTVSATLAATFKERDAFSRRLIGYVIATQFEPEDQISEAGNFIESFGASVDHYLKDWQDTFVAIQDGIMEC